MKKELLKSLNKKTWSGTFEQFFEEKFEKNPKLLSRSAHKYLFDALHYFGLDKDNLPKVITDEIYGMKDEIREFMELLEAASKGHDVKKRILLFVGPVGTAKSTLVSILKRTLERYSLEQEGEIYALDNCPMHESPLNLLPDSYRKELKEVYNITVEQYLCPKCAYRLEHEFEGDILKFPVKQITLSERERRGIATFVPADYNSQDSSVLVGSENFVEIQKYGDTSHPLAWNFNGALFSGNRGITELIEIHKARADLLYPLLVLAEERKIKVDRFGLIDADEILIAHTNYTENAKFKAKKENEALIDRSREIEWRYNLVWNEEENIYKKMLGNPEFHLAPWTTKIIAGVSILSRLEQDKRNKKYDLLTSLKMYNNELQHLYNEAHFEDMKHENDGRFGISPRVAVDAISFASVGKKCVSPIEALIKLKEVITKANVEIRQGSLDSLSELIQKEYDKFIKDLVFRAFIGTAFEKEAQTYFNKYIEHAFASVNNEKVKDPYSNKYVDFDEKFLRSIEEVIGISKEAAKDFRTKLLIKVSALKEKGEILRYDIHPELKNAIENKVFGDRSSLIRGSITSVVKTEESEKQIKDAIKYLVENENFCEICAKEAIDYVAWLLDRIG